MRTRNYDLKKGLFWVNPFILINLGQYLVNFDILLMRTRNYGIKKGLFWVNPFILINLGQFLVNFDNHKINFLVHRIFTFFSIFPHDRSTEFSLIFLLFPLSFGVISHPIRSRSRHVDPVEFVVRLTPTVHGVISHPIRSRHVDPVRPGTTSRALLVQSDHDTHIRAQSDNDIPYRILTYFLGFS